MIAQRTTSEKKAFADKAKQIYAQYYQSKLEQSSKGMYAGILVETEECFVAESKLQVYYKAKKKHENPYLFFIRIGLPLLKKRGTRRRRK